MLLILVVIILQSPLVWFYQLHNRQFARVQQVKIPLLQLNYQIKNCGFIIAISLF